ncbi:hypothetical protein CMUS01_04018 [Colletotrichum musicola]|uniref:Uncharacterized protein n=1 Tax=Colletotrichum musicola TaxID=2175873 RepID=A0A8H6U4B4_9PEZI|nr:hypothetical protein CMUS01_04018 [Colletotrichum musicola]
MIETKSWYVMRLYNVSTRYGLTKNARRLLQLLDDVKGRPADQTELGRQMRLGHENREAIPETIRKCASMMVKNPDETKTCLQLIDMCTQILDIVNRKPNRQGFPFLTLPRGIRARVLDVVVDGTHGGIEQFIRVQWDYRCGCVNPERQAFETISDQQLPIFNTLGKAMEDEFWTVLFRNRARYFPCYCCLYHNLMDDGTFCRHLRNVHIHGCGPKADKAFEQLTGHGLSQAPKPHD